MKSMFRIVFVLKTSKIIMQFLTQNFQFVSSSGR